MASIKRIGKNKSGVPIWEAVYRRTPGGKQVRKRFYLPLKADVERAILVETQSSGIDLRWSEGVQIYLKAKLTEGCSPLSMEHVERAAKVFISLMGDLEIEETTLDQFKEYMQLAANQPVKHKYSGKQYRISGPKVANKHRKELLTVSRYLRAHTGKISTIPFEHVPPLPTKTQPRSPIPGGQVASYLDALPPHVLRPVKMVLLYGLRSTATCILMLSSIHGGMLHAVDKGDNQREIPIDDPLDEIISDAKAYRSKFSDLPFDNIFVNANGRPWNRMTLLHAAQRAWERAGLPQKKIHEIRHTLGTLAGKSFTPGMVQAAMGHRSRKSAEAYFHPNDDMAREVREKIITDLSQFPKEQGIISSNQPELTYTKDGIYQCPCCSSKFLISKKKGHKP